MKVKSRLLSWRPVALDLNQRTHQEISDLLNEILELFVAGFKVLFFFLGFLQRVLHLVLHIQRQRGDILQLRTGNTADDKRYSCRINGSSPDILEV